MYNTWKKLFIAVVVLLVGASAVGGYSLYKWNVTKDQLIDTEVKLSNTLIELDNTKARLVDTEAQLNTMKAQLVDTEAQLNTTKAQLIDTEDELDNTEAQLVDTEAQLSTITAELYLTENQLDMTANQLETEKNKNSQVLNQYASLREQVNTRLGDTSEDKQNFITPNNSLVSAKVLEITGGYSGEVNDYWKDCERLYRWVVNNISYSYDSYMPVLPENISDGLVWQQDYWRIPQQTIEDKTGDCEDMAVLLASMLRNYNEGEYAIWVLVIRSGQSGHVAVAFPVQGGRLTILDPAGNYYTGQYGSLDSSDISIAVNNWLSHWQSQMPDAEIIRVFSEDILKEFSSTAEFITWAQE